MEDTGRSEDRNSSLISEEKLDLRNSQFSLSNAAKPLELKENTLNLPKNTQNYIFSEHQKDSEAEEGETGQEIKSQTSNIEDEPNQLGLNELLKGNEPVNEKDNSEIWFYQSKVKFLENEIKLRDQQLLAVHQNIKDNERRVEDLLDLIQSERKQICEKELVLKDKEHSIQEFKRLKQMISLEKYNNLTPVKEEDKRKECQNGRCLENSIELLSLRRKFDELKREFEKQKMQKKSLEITIANFSKDPLRRESDQIMKKI